MGSIGACYLLVSLVLMCFLSSAIGVTSVQQKMQDDMEISEFWAMMARSETVNLTLSIRHVTIFVPTNRAFQNIELDDALKTDDRLVRYHMINLARRTDQLGDKLSSDLDGNPPLWVTYKNNDIYINNARLLLNDATQVNIVTRNARNMEQIVHKIDEVLVPVISPKNSNNEVFDPNAWDFIENYEHLTNIKSHRIRTFRQKIINNKKQDIFRNGEGHTFFIPIDDGFTNPKSDSVDAKVIDGHVIPKKVLFTTPTNKDERFETLADTDNVKVFISFFQETEGKSKIISVKSHTVFADNNHTKGVVMANIVQANIPVRNGVVHLIQKPLMVVDQTVKQFLDEKENGVLSRFRQEIADAGDVGRDFLRTLDKANHLTLFAPTNSAWEDANLKVLLKDKSRIKDILNMHLIDKRVYMDQIYNRQTVKEPTLTSQQSLFFSVIDNKDRVIMVEGGGVTATVLQPDIAASNGVIHITNRVFGVPYSTIYDKLRQDPTLNDTNFLVSKTAFHEQLNDTSKKFTFFVPSAKAWVDASLDMPSAIKTLFMKEFSYHAEQILEKHLVIADTPFKMENIKALGENNREVELDTVRDKLKISVEERKDHNNPARNSTFIIHWKGKKIPVFRPNLECTNGVIHVIDYPFIIPGDIRVTSNGANALSIVPHLFMILIAKWLLL